jgi:hypothetical protein
MRMCSLVVIMAIALLCGIVVPVPLHAQTRQSDSVEAALSQLVFISGRWLGEWKGGVIEEQWSAPEGDNMMGMFRLVKDGEGVFYEFMTIEQAGDTPVLRMRHFSQGLLAWEEKDNIDRYPLVELGDARAVFENQDKGIRLVYARDGDMLTITLDKPENGGRIPQVFSFRRAK